jgi:hypothetical protein
LNKTTVRTLLAGACATALLAAAPSAASAHYFMGKAEAENNAWDFATERYDVTDPGTYCRPQGENKADPHYDYRRWVCGWSEDGCGGAVLIIGSHVPHRYYYRVLRGERCD